MTKRICKFCKREFTKKGKGTYCTKLCRTMDYSLRRTQAKTHKSKPDTTQDIQTLCWKCNKCYGGCSWSDLSFTPVEGWEAIRSVKVDALGFTYDAYTVVQCPEFEPDRRFI